ncbi:uncharacterized protein DUF2312 [Blastomonas natatoria]|uniref:Uncharacterized protein DUF2312 n=1 Tax=Blastomonas natatoria TaxID=34015 RepID=A0A2V3UPS9_9SPHN|nr:uncharacterized protein DUF2312 [Blastomonas natatoria]
MSEAISADDQLRLFIERIERLEEERRGVAAGLRWADNPRVRIITFRLVRQNIDAWLGCQRGAAAQPKLAAAVPETTAASSAHADRPVCSAAPSATMPGHERT